MQHLFAQSRTLEVKDGVLYRQFQYQDGSVLYYQLVVPRSPRALVLQNVHADVTSGHFGVRKTTEKLERHAYWKGHKKDVKTFVRKCSLLRTKVSTFQRAAVIDMDLRPSKVGCSMVTVELYGRNCMWT